jgi:glyoxylase-like metal-dependent hydrolase (beta-lactamase superfamily II)
MALEIKHFVVGPLLTNCYLLVSNSEADRLKGEARLFEAAVIDPGGGAKSILKEIEKSRAKLKFIILTHGHWDHTLSALKIKQKTGAKILFSKAEKEFIKIKADQFLKEGEEIKIGDSVLKVIPTPGHTKGSICLSGKNEIFTGDTIFKDGYGRTDLAGGSQKDLENSLKKLSKILKPGVRVYPGHGETFEIK